MKKITIISSKSGGGHISATQALTAYLQDLYEIESVYLYSELLKPIDIIHFLSFGKYNCIKLWNTLARKKWYTTLNLIKKTGLWLLRTRKNKIQTIIERYLNQHPTNMIISVTPALNGIILNICKAKKIPFLIVPADLDAKLYVRGINKPTYAKFHIAYAFNNPLITQTIETAQIPPKQQSAIGYPVRPLFFSFKDDETIKQKMGIPLHKPVVTVVMGSLDSPTLLTFAHTLKKYTTPIHIIFCVGNMQKYRNKIETLNFSKDISVTTNPCQAMSDILAITDILITKPGTARVCEALYANVPMILNATTKVLPWEQLNLTFVEQYHFGKVLTKIEDLSQIVSLFLTDENTRILMSNSLGEFRKKHAGREIRSIVAQLLA